MSDTTHPFTQAAEAAEAVTRDLDDRIAALAQDQQATDGDLLIAVKHLQALEGRVAVLEEQGAIQPPVDPPVDPIDPVEPPVTPPATGRIPTLGWNTSFHKRWSGDWLLPNAALRTNQIVNDPASKFDDLVGARRGDVSFVVGDKPLNFMCIQDCGQTAPAGEWIVEWDGDGEVVFGPPRDQDHNPVQYTVQGNHYHVASPFSWADLQVVRSNSHDPVRNIRLWVPGGKDKPMSDASAEALAGCAVLRFMDWQHTNNSPVKHWSDRTNPDSMFQGTSNGVAYEHQLRTAIAAGAEPWINVPYGATDDFCIQLGKLIKELVPVGVRVWIEYTNEFWNGAGPFKQGHDYIQALATAGYKGAQHLPHAYGIRAAEVWQLIAAETGADSIVRVLGGQAANKWQAAEAMLKAHQHGDRRVDALAITAYFEMGVVRETLEQKWHESGDLDAFFGFLLPRVYDPDRWSYVDEHKAIADAYNVPLVAYEGGSHICGSVVGWQGTENKVLTDFLARAHEDSRMGDATINALRNWYIKSDNGLHCAFTLNYVPTKHGNWGHLKGTHDDLTKADRWLAAVATAVSAHTGKLNPKEPDPTPPPADTAEDFEIIWGDGGGDIGVDDKRRWVDAIDDIDIEGKAPEGGGVRIWLWSAHRGQEDWDGKVPTDGGTYLLLAQGFGKDLFEADVNDLTRETEKDGVTQRLRRWLTVPERDTLPDLPDPAPVDPPADDGDLPAWPVSSDPKLLQAWLPVGYDSFTTKGESPKSGSTIRKKIIYTDLDSWSTFTLRHRKNVTIDDCVIITRHKHPERGGGGGITIEHCTNIVVRNVRVIAQPVFASHRDRSSGIYAAHTNGLVIAGFAMIGGGDSIVPETHEGFYSHCMYLYSCKNVTLLNIAGIDGHGAVIKVSADSASEDERNENWRIEGIFGWGYGFLVAFSFTNERGRNVRGANHNMKVRLGRHCRADGMFAKSDHDGIRGVWTNNTDKTVTVEDCSIWDTDKSQNFPGIVAGENDYTDLGGNEDRRGDVYITESELAKLRADLVRHGFSKPELLPHCLRAA
ncbi:MAG: hypothetical protein AAGD32_13785 [Planctomycetota bacterium]